MDLLVNIGLKAWDIATIVLRELARRSGENTRRTYASGFFGLQLGVQSLITR